MSLPSSCAIDEDSPVRATRASRCGRAMSHNPSDATKSGPAPRPAMPPPPGMPLPAEHPLLAARPLRLVLEVGVLVRVVEDRGLGLRLLREHPRLPDLLAALLLQVVDRVFDLRPHRREVDADQLP